MIYCVRTEGFPSGKEGEKFMKNGSHIRTAVLCCVMMFALLLGVCGCDGEVVPTEAGLTYDPVAAAELRDRRQVYLTVWSWQIPTVEEAEKIAQAAKADGFTAVDLGVMWAHFEPLRNHFDFSWLDGTVKVFRDAGLPVSLQPLFWTKDLSWADDLAAQQTAHGDPYSYAGRGILPCLSDENTVSVLRNSLQAFALHASREYGDILTRWGVRLSCFGEFDFSVNEELDFSPASQAAFFDALKEEYRSYEALAERYPTLPGTREGLEALGLCAVRETCTGEWKAFRQKVLTDFFGMTSDVFRAADGSVPIVFSLGTYGNGLNVAYSGWNDAGAAWECDFDILSFAFSDGADPAMMLSFFASSGKELSAELDGAWALEGGADLSAQAELCGKFGVFSLAMANYSAEQLEKFRAPVSGYAKSFWNCDATLGDAPADAAILILPEAEKNGYSFDAIYGAAWKLLSHDGTRRVTFLNRTQIGEHPESAAGISSFAVGNVSGTVELARYEALLFKGATFYADAEGLSLTVAKPKSEIDEPIEDLPEVKNLRDLPGADAEKKTDAETTEKP